MKPEKTAFLQSTDDHNFVDSIKCIELAQKHKIKITKRFCRTKTQEDLVKFREWLYTEIRKKDPEFGG